MFEVFNFTAVTRIADMAINQTTTNKRDKISSPNLYYYYTPLFWATRLTLTPRGLFLQ